MTEPKVVNAEDFSLTVVIEVGKDWSLIPFSERKLDINAPYNSLCSFAYNCGDVLQSLIHTTLAEGLEKYKAEYKNELERQAQE